MLAAPLHVAQLPLGDFLLCCACTVAALKCICKHTKQHPMSSVLAQALIHGYRRYLSPHKGYRCAYGAHTGLGTCSGQGLRIFSRVGLFKGLMLLRRQFDRCTLAAHALREAAAERQRAQRLTMKGQRGFVDCDVGGCDGCDIGGCDAPSCDTPNCADCTPDCGPAFDGAMTTLDCCSPSPGTRAALCCADSSSCAPCDCGPSRSNPAERVNRAVERGVKRQAQRDARRSDSKKRDDEDGADSALDSQLTPDSED
jgi:uncharacterized protein